MKGRHPFSLSIDGMWSEKNQSSSTYLVCLTTNLYTKVGLLLCFFLFFNMLRWQMHAHDTWNQYQKMNHFLEISGDQIVFQVQVEHITYFIISNTFSVLFSITIFRNKNQKKKKNTQFRFEPEPSSTKEDQWYNLFKIFITIYWLRIIDSAQQEKQNKKGEFFQTIALSNKECSILLHRECA